MARSSGCIGRRQLELHLVVRAVQRAGEADDGVRVDEPGRRHRRACSVRYPPGIGTSRRRPDALDLAVAPMRMTPSVMAAPAIVWTVAARTATCAARAPRRASSAASAAARAARLRRRTTLVAQLALVARLRRCSPHHSPPSSSPSARGSRRAPRRSRPSPRGDPRARCGRRPSRPRPRSARRACRRSAGRPRAR